jgi:hypothetical protein
MDMNSNAKELSSKNDPRPHFLFHIVGAGVLALAGAISLAAGIVDREIVRTQENDFAMRYADSPEAFDRAEKYLQYASWIPAVERRLNDVRARRASMYYWQRQYDRIVPQDGDPLAGIPAENVDLQLIAANAAYRKSQPGAKDRTNALRALDAAINAYVAVLRNGAHEAAAYNYEYLVRTREDIDKGRQPADLTERAEDGPAGEQGGIPQQDADKKDLKILIPLEPGEMDKAIEPGKGTPIDRKG